MPVHVEGRYGCQLAMMLWSAEAVVVPRGRRERSRKGCRGGEQVGMTRGSGEHENPQMRATSLVCEESSLRITKRYPLPHRPLLKVRIAPRFTQLLGGFKGGPLSPRANAECVRLVLKIEFRASSHPRGLSHDVRSHSPKWTATVQVRCDLLAKKA